MNSGISMIWQWSGSGRVRMRFAAMNALISRTVARASATSVSGVPWSLATASSTRRVICASALGVVGRDGLAGEGRAPELPGDHGHLALDAVGLRLGLRQHLVGRDPRVELQVQLLDEQLAADPPLAVERGRTSSLRNARCSSSAATIVRGLLAELALPLRLARRG